MRVLIIESDPAFAREASEALRERGVEATIVEDGQEGMEAARTERPDALILSVELGDRPQAGFSYCNRIKKDEELKEIPLLLVSAHVSEETFEQHRRLRTRADGYLRKPFTLKPFLEAMESMVPGIFENEALGQPGAGRTERFGWSEFEDEPPTSAEEAEDEPLFEAASEQEGDGDLDLDGIFGKVAAEEAWGESVSVAAVAPAPAAVIETPPALSEPPSLPRAEAPEATIELESIRRELESTRTELEAARRESAELGERLASAEARLREALAAREEAERKLEELGQLRQNASAFEERFEALQQELSAKESEAVGLRQRLDQVEQVRQRAQKALKVANELLRSIEFSPERP